MSTTEYLGHAAFVGVGEETQRPPAGNAATANFPAATTAPHNGQQQQHHQHRRTPTAVAPKSPLPDRTKFGEDDEADDADIEEEEDDDDCADEDEEEEDEDRAEREEEDDEEVVGASPATRQPRGRQQSTKDCVDYEPSAPPLTDVAAVSVSVDETDHVHHRFGAPKQTKNGSSPQTACGGRLQLPPPSQQYPAHEFDLSGLSSAVSSAAPSTVCSPLSSPTRHMPASPPQHHSSHRHCCRKSAAAKAAAEDAGGGGVGGGGSDDCGGSSTMAGFQQSPHHHLHHHHQQQQQHHHNHHNAYHASAASGGGCKKLQKFDPRKSPSPYRQLLPVVLCILSFATVFSLLIVYMDTTEIRHKQFKLNMSRDSDLHTVAQDNPTLIAFLREIHMRKYPMHFLKNARDTPGADQQQQQHQQFNFSNALHHDEPAARMARYVADLVGGKTSGAVIQSLPGPLGQFMTAPWLAESLNWGGVIVEPEPRRFFTLRKENAQRTQLQLVHACVSPQPYPKEVVIHNEDSEVRINSLLDEETSWFNSRVKCFPLYTIMLACNRVEYDLLSLGVHGHELEILHTLPFDKIKIDVISIHLTEDMDDARSYLQAITKFLVGKAYKFQKSFGRNYFYQRINSTSRTRKKDILLLKTP